MQTFSVQRFATEGPANSIIEGQVLRHFPDTDTLEIEGVRVLWTDDQGRKTLATARRALSSADGSDVQLMGEAHVVRDPAPQPGADDAGRIEFRSEYLQVLAHAQRVRTERPVTLIQGASQLQAGSLHYDHRAGIFELGGRVRGTLAAVAEAGGDSP
jgi:lipopolysaccharide export system protein LptC